MEEGTLKGITPDVVREMESQLDPAGMMSIAFNLDKQITGVLEISKEWEPPMFKPNNILIIGLGGSAIGGDLVRALTERECTVPIVMCRDYDIPGFVNENTLCITASYSGNTEETLAAYEKCHRQGAKIVTLSTGGKLKEMAQRDGAPFCEIPAGYQPRAALGLSFTAQLLILSKLGLVKDYREQLKEAAAYVRDLGGRWRSWNDPGENPPLELALNLADKIPIIYGSPGFYGTMAYRWKCQFNENAKAYAVWNVMPELNHNEVVGWEGIKNSYNSKAVVFLRGPEDSPRIKARVDLTAKFISKKAGVMDIYACGENDLQKLFYLILYGDLATIYLAYLYHRDPSTIESIVWLKGELAKI